jgi:hypothetical protein
MKEIFEKTWAANFFANLKPTGNLEGGYRTYYHDKEWINRILSQRGLAFFTNHEVKT